MARLARIVVPGIAHHVTQRGNRRLPVFFSDPLTDVAALGRHVRNWRALLRHGLETGGVDEEGEAVVEAIEQRLRTGRPLAAAEWIAKQEAAAGHPLAPRPPGRRKKAPA